MQNCMEIIEISWVIDAKTKQKSINTINLLVIQQRSECSVNAKLGRNY